MGKTVFYCPFSVPNLRISLARYIFLSKMEGEQGEEKRQKPLCKGKTS